MSGFARFVGIDWSGAKGSRQPGIAVALCEADGTCGLVRPPGGGSWSREAALGYLAACPPGTLAGLDFAFSLPWPEAGPLPPGLDQPADARHLWRMVDDLCRAEPHLYAGPAYHPEGGWLADYMFTKLTGRELWRGHAYAPDRLRRTEMVLSPRPNSVFRIVGARTVGPGSFSGMRVLAALERAMGDGFAAWPFDPPGRGLTLAEIYPSLYYALAGRRRSRDPGVVDAVLGHFGAQRVADEPIRSQDEADALVAAAALRHIAARPGAFERPSEAYRQEGWIFGVPPA